MIYNINIAMEQENLIKNQEQFLKIAKKMNLKPIVKQIQQDRKSVRQITKLSLYGLKLKNFCNLSLLTNLISLNLGGNFLQKIQNLDEQKQLKMLFLSNNKITKIENLQKLTNLLQLYLGKNKIQKLAGLDYCLNLKQLYLKQNQLVSIQQISRNSFQNLKRLFLNDNNIVDIRSLRRINTLNLQQLNLSDNKIVELYKIFQMRLPKLKEALFGELEEKKLINLQWIWKLQSNEIQQFSQIRTEYPPTHRREQLQRKLKFRNQKFPKLHQHQRW